MLIKILKWVLIIAVVSTAGAAFAGWRYYERYMTSAGPLNQETIVQIPRGAGFSQITDILRDAGLVNEPLLFRLHARIEGLDTELKAGEYLIPAAISPRDLLDTMARGDALMHSVTVPEGLNNYQVLEIVAAADVLEGDITLTPEEGTLLPETFLVQRGETRDGLIQRMQTDLQTVLDEAWETRDPDLPYATKDEVLIMASIIEKETALADEYGKVASVFVNRLRKGQRLETDPTVIFALTEGKHDLGRQLLFKDLEVIHPYNTYQIPALPPGPIANPGRGAIMAAVSPDETDYYFFVADGSGGHAFARNFAEHQKNVAAWRKFQRTPRPPAIPNPKPDTTQPE